MFFLLRRCALTTFFHFLQIGWKSAHKLGCKSPKLELLTKSKKAERTSEGTLVCVWKAVGKWAEHQ